MRRLAMATCFRPFIRLRPVVLFPLPAEQFHEFHELALKGFVQHKAPSLKPAALVTPNKGWRLSAIHIHPGMQKCISTHKESHSSASWVNPHREDARKPSSQFVGPTVGVYLHSLTGGLFHKSGTWNVTTMTRTLTVGILLRTCQSKCVPDANLEALRLRRGLNQDPSFCTRWMTSQIPQSTPATPTFPGALPIPSKSTTPLDHHLSSTHSIAPKSILGTIRTAAYRLPGNIAYFGHAASLFGLLALFQKDMLWLRSFLICGSLCGIAFNLLQPHPLKIPAAYGGIFILLNLTMIAFLLNERLPVDFKNEELELYELVFQKHGVTPHQFLRLIHSPGMHWLNLPAGHALLKEGEYVNYIYVLVSGGAKVSKTGEMCGHIQRGSLVGETALLAKGHKAGHSVTTTEPSRVAMWPKHELRQLLTDDPSLLLSTSKVINSDLAAKLAHSNVLVNQAHAFLTYKEVLKGICADEVITPHEKRALREYRTRHNITPAQHAEALAHCGWTLDEYEDGAKRDSWMYFGIVNSISSFNRGVQQMVESATGNWTSSKTSSSPSSSSSSSSSSSTQSQQPNASTTPATSHPDCPLPPPPPSPSPPLFSGKTSA